MLNVMRDNLRSLKWVLWIVAIAMTLYLGDFFFDRSAGGASGDWAARIDDTEISAQELRRTARNLDRGYRQMLGTSYDQLKGSIRLGTEALQALLQRELILADAQRLGLSVSPQELARRIWDDPSFHDESGKFIGKERYTERLEQALPGGVAAFEAALRQDLLVDKWHELIAQAVTVGESELERVYRERHETTSLRYVVVPAASQDVPPSAADDELRRWYAEHPDLYRREAGRKIRYVVVSRAAQREQVQVSDEEVRAAYDAKPDEHARPAQRKVRHILVRTTAGAPAAERAAARARAEELLRRVRSGEEFEKLARESSDDEPSAERGGDLGWFPRGRMVAEFDAAAFETPVGQLAPLVETQFGYHVLQVTGEQAAGVTPFEEVGPALRRRLELERAQQQVVSVAERLKGRIASPQALSTVAAEEGLEVESRFVARGDRLGDLGASPQFLEAVFDGALGSVTAPVAVAAGQAIVAIDEEVGAALAPFDEVRERVLQDWSDERGRNAALHSARQALERAGDLAAAARALKVEVQQTDALRPAGELPGTGGLSAEARAALFGESAAAGAAGVVPVPDGALLYEITSRQLHDPAQFELAKRDLYTELLQDRQDELRRTLLERIHAQARIEVNQAEIERLNG
jgi:peptidyl-prolyl cis-trans isomerase D